MNGRARRGYPNNSFSSAVRAIGKHIIICGGCKIPPAAAATEPPDTEAAYIFIEFRLII